MKNQHENLEQQEVVEVASTEKKIWNWLNKYAYCLLRLGLVLIFIWAGYLLINAWNNYSVKKHIMAIGKPLFVQDMVKEGLDKYQIADRYCQAVNKLYHDYVEFAPDKKEKKKKDKKSKKESK